jgi:hypothetical protein
MEHQINGTDLVPIKITICDICKTLQADYISNVDNTAVCSECVKEHNIPIIE